MIKIIYLMLALIRMAIQYMLRHTVYAKQCKYNLVFTMLISLRWRNEGEKIGISTKQYSKTGNKIRKEQLEAMGHWQSLPFLLLLLLHFPFQDSWIKSLVAGIEQQQQKSKPLAGLLCSLAEFDTAVNFCHYTSLHHNLLTICPDLILEIKNVNSVCLVSFPRCINDSYVPKCMNDSHPFCNSKISKLCFCHIPKIIRNTLHSEQKYSRTTNILS